MSVHDPIGCSKLLQVSSNAILIDIHSVTEDINLTIIGFCNIPPTDEYAVSFVTGFAKRGLPHTSNSIVFKNDSNLKVSPSINRCWCSSLTKFTVNNFFQSQVMNCQSM